MKLITRKKCLIGIICAIIIILILVNILCINASGWSLTKPYFSIFSIEQHVERLTKRTEENYAAELADGTIVGFKVDVMYDYEDYPRFYIIELEYKDPLLGYHLQEDENGFEEVIYYQTNYKYINIYPTLYGLKYKCEKPVRTRHPFSLTENFDKKKYYLCDILAIENDREIIQIVNYDCEHENKNEYGVSNNICDECYGKTITDIKDNKYRLPYYYEVFYSFTY